MVVSGGGGVWPLCRSGSGLPYCPDSVKIWNINARMHDIDNVNNEATPC
jgi:hypothetical protein